MDITSVFSNNFFGEHIFSFDQTLNIENLEDLLLTLSYTVTGQVLPGME